MMRAPGVPRVVRVRFPLVVGSTPAIVGPKLSNMALSSTQARTPAFHAGKPGSTPGRVTIWGRGAIGSAIPLQGKGQGFKSPRFHQHVVPRATTWMARTHPATVRSELKAERHTRYRKLWHLYGQVANRQTRRTVNPFFIRQWARHPPCPPYYRDIVQLVERQSGGLEATGSSPVISTTADSAAQ